MDVEVQAKVTKHPDTADTKNKPRVPEAVCRVGREQDTLEAAVFSRHSLPHSTKHLLSCVRASERCMPFTSGWGRGRKSVDRTGQLRNFVLCWGEADGLSAVLEHVPNASSSLPLILSLAAGRR